MGILEIIMIAVGLSMDAFAVSVCKGLSMKKLRWSYAFLAAAMFGLFQAGMPLLGYFLGTTFASFVSPVDHWITFVLLGFIGGKMVWDGIHDDGEEEAEAEDSDLQAINKGALIELVGLAVATSIDAFAVGCSFAFMAVDIWQAIAVIGVTTFLLSLGGFLLGHRFGSRYNRPATIAGGIVLIIIGLKTLLSHLGILNL